MSKLYKYIYKRQLPADPYHELFNDPTNLDSKRYYTDVIFRQNEIITWQIPKDFVIREILKKSKIKFSIKYAKEIYILRPVLHPIY